jgi:hypothetical protein
MRSGDEASYSYILSLGVMWDEYFIIIIIIIITIIITITTTLTLREEHRLRVFENRVLRRIFGLKRDEVTGEWRKLHNEELRDLYSSPSIIRIIKSRRMRWRAM